MDTSPGAAAAADQQIFHPLPESQIPRLRGGLGRGGGVHVTVLSCHRARSVSAIHTSSRSPPRPSPTSCPAFPPLSLAPACPPARLPAPRLASPAPPVPP